VPHPQEKRYDSLSSLVKFAVNWSSESFGSGGGVAGVSARGLLTGSGLSSSKEPVHKNLMEVNTKEQDH